MSFYVIIIVEDKERYLEMIVNVKDYAGEYPETYETREVEFGKYSKRVKEYRIYSSDYGRLPNNYCFEGAITVYKNGCVQYERGSIVSMVISPKFLDYLSKEMARVRKIHNL